MNRKLRRTELYMTLLFAAVIILLTFFLTTFLLGRSSANLGDYVSRLVSADSRQIGLNIDSYLETVEQTAALLFSDEQYYGYDETNTTLSAYEKLVAEQAILDKIVDLGLMQNFSDFGIVYSDDHTVGWISQVTSAMFPSGGMYQEFTATITNLKTYDGWSFGRHGNYDRLYYTKRLNENAIILVSFYNKELDQVFNQPADLADMTLRLVSASGQVLYSTLPGELGTLLPVSVRDMLDRGQATGQRAQTDLTTVNICKNGWKVLVSIPIASLMQESNELYRQTIIVSLSLSVIILTLGLIIYKRLSSSVNDVVEELNDKATQDLMTGLLNKASFTDLVDAYLQAYTGKQANAFLMFDLDNFKYVNDTLGHAKGDEVVIQMARILRQVFPEEFFIGRIGGDEFAACCSYTMQNREEALALIRAYVDELFEQFNLTFQDIQRECGLSVSVGAVVAGPGEYHYQDLYDRADKVLYVSKRSGKNRVTYE